MEISVKGMLWLFNTPLTRREWGHPSAEKMVMRPISVYREAYYTLRGACQRYIESTSRHNVAKKCERNLIALCFPPNDCRATAWAGFSLG